ncbi:MAG: hypothetical protein JSV03_17155 [Planctomycetota bacterium]|nr:MAG: hypothetical protein JSV03_17155 [Planctomycetota bacterium]
MKHQNIKPSKQDLASFGKYVLNRHDTNNVVKKTTIRKVENQKVDTRGARPAQGGLNV